MEAMEEWQQCWRLLNGHSYAGPVDTRRQMIAEMTRNELAWRAQQTGDKPTYNEAADVVLVMNNIVTTIEMVGPLPLVAAALAWRPHE